ncbi:MAG: tetratricopeptide repeat protein [Nitrospina sp.]|jgi:tetratricopeptide (TPR) repeat protein|nr:tetratricopeptide repeat protein [Nitrospina sp.]MBT3857094.1 tetratricopeptide repeat protein [Nitrospina sp.]MBT4104371.1 tetratricopeptide repeat protein [Nitrospina sp.]MBT4389962.1 tetratricopeptide repeat protein [Nitrospina sp.]MBT4622406.1 tetratricopeptide repeat protein [Nitrospina sp.]
MNLHSSTRCLENKSPFFKFILLLSICLLISCGGEDSDEPDRAKMEEARKAFSEENFDKAKSNVEYFLAQYPEDVEALYFYAEVLIQTGQELKARERANEILAIDPTLPEAKAILAEVHYSRREFNEALKLSRQALKQNPQLQAPYRVIGDIYLRQGKIKAGIQVLLEAHKFAPENVDTLKKLSAGYIKNKDYASAKKYLDMAMKLDDHVPGIHYNMAVVYANMNNGQKALEHVDLALEYYKDLGTFFWAGKSRDMRRLIVKKYKLAE